MDSQAEIFYLAVWKAVDDLSDKEAARHYAVLSEESAGKFDVGVYRFQAQLTIGYPDLDMLSEEESGTSPWARPLQVSDDHVVMALRHDRYAEVFPFILELATAHGLVCFDPHNTKVHLPRRRPEEPRPGRTETPKAEHGIVRTSSYRMTKREWIEIVIGLFVLFAIWWVAGPAGPTDKSFTFPLR